MLCRGAAARRPRHDTTMFPRSLGGAGLGVREISYSTIIIARAPLTDTIYVCKAFFGCRDPLDTVKCLCYTTAAYI